MANLRTLYSLLFALSLVLINPWGFERGDIWTQPKLVAICLITLCNSGVILKRHRLALSLNWKVGLGLWTLFLGVGLTATLLSPFPLRSLWGQLTLGDGWLYWLLLALFTLSNALVLQIAPMLLQPQLYGLLIGGILVAFSIFPQVYDWRIDYTATSGLVSLSSPQMLESTVWQSQMPICLYSNRGHAAFVLAVLGVLPLLGWHWGWISLFPAIAVCLLASISLGYAQVRSGSLALLVSGTYLLWPYCPEALKRWVRQPWTKLCLTSCLLFGLAVLCLGNPEQFSSGRLHLWQLSLSGIAARPLWGWGFDGFGIAYPFIADWTGTHQGYLLEKVAVAQVMGLNEFTFDYQGTDGYLHTGILISNKAHNLLLDTTLSVGLPGLLCYVLLWGFFLRCTASAARPGIEAVAIAYLVYTFTWYESAQFSHLPWWALSVGLGCPSRLSLASQSRDYEPEV